MTGKRISALVLLAFLAIPLASAQAGWRVSFGFGPACVRPWYPYRVVIGPAPVYVVAPPRPVYVVPAPVYVQQVPVYVQPAPVYVQPAPYYGQPVYVQPAPGYWQPAQAAQPGNPNAPPQAKPGQ